MKTEVLQLLAAMFEMLYDDLRQRHRERRIRRILTATALGATACLLFGVYSTVTAIRIQRQNEQIEAQSAENYLADGNRVAADETAVESLTISDGIELPYTPEAQMILTESIRAYDTESLTLFDLETREVIKVLSGEEMTSAYTFLGEKYFIYEKPSAVIDDVKKLIVYDLEEKSTVKEIEVSDDMLTLHADKEGKYLVGKTWGNDIGLCDTCIIYKSLYELRLLMRWTDPSM